jgi:hypothetical protein
MFFVGQVELKVRVIQTSATLAHVTKGDVSVLGHSTFIGAATSRLNASIFYS